MGITDVHSPWAYFITVADSNHQMEGWYKVSRTDVTHRGGAGLFAYHASLRKALLEAFPSYPWEAEKFVHKDRPYQAHRYPHNWWNNAEHRKQLIRGLEAEFNITEVILRDLLDNLLPST